MGILVINEYGKDAREFRMGEDAVDIGRDPHAEIVLGDLGASRRHARILPQSGRFLLEDLGSRNGTIVNDAKIGQGETRALHDGDVIRIGRSILRFILRQSRRITTGRVKKDRTSDVQATMKGGIAMVEDKPLSLFRLQKIEARLVIVQEGKPPDRHSIASDRVRIGRSPEMDIVLADQTVSAHHAEIIYNNEGFHIVDRDSTWGTFLNGHAVRVERLSSGDVLRFGKAQALFLIRHEADEPPAPSFRLRDQLAEVHPEKKAEIQEVFRLCREQALDFGEELIIRGTLDPEAWWGISGKRREPSSSPGGGFLGRLFGRRSPRREVEE